MLSMVKKQQQQQNHNSTNQRGSVKTGWHSSRHVCECVERMCHHFVHGILTGLIHSFTLEMSLHTKNCALPLLLLTGVCSPVGVCLQSIVYSTDRLLLDFQAALKRPLLLLLLVYLPSGILLPKARWEPQPPRSGGALPRAPMASALPTRQVGKRQSIIVLIFSSWITSETE